MTCQTVPMPGGGFAIVCGPRPRRHRCSEPGCTRDGTRQCDHPVGPNGRICDRYICEDHARRIGPDLDHCPRHASASPAPAARQGDLFA